MFSIIEHGSVVWKEAVLLRENILRKPLGEQFTAEELEAERDHIQVVGIVNNEVIATAVLVPEGHNYKMQRVVVSEHFRNQNIGSKMMLFCETYAKERAAKSIYCHARDSAVNFYLRNQYQAIGNYFNEDGIPHLKMKKGL